MVDLLDESDFEVFGNLTLRFVERIVIFECC